VRPRLAPGRAAERPAAGLFHSYFDGEADGTDDLPFPKDGVLEDALPILLRGWNGAYLKAGETRSVPFLPSLLWARLNHRPLAWTTARVARAASPRSVTVAAGRFQVDVYSVELADGRKLGFEIEASAPYRLVRQTGPKAQELASAARHVFLLAASTPPGGEKHLKELACAAVVPRDPDGPGPEESHRGRLDMERGRHGFAERDPERRRSSVPTGSIIRWENHSCNDNLALAA